MSPETFLAQDGTFERAPSQFRETDLEPVAGRYHLYVSYACPWAHRTIIGRRLKGLENVIGMSVVDPIRDDRGWRFSGGEYVDGVNGFAFLAEAYAATSTAYTGRISVPVLWDTRERRIVNNESADILRLFTTVFGELGDGAVDLWPEPLRDEMEELGERIYEQLNNGVYRAGFGTNQAAYEQIVDEMFVLLAELDARLADRRCLFGDDPVETDWRLFTTLVRFDAVYAIHFKCSRRRILDHPNLVRYAAGLYRDHGIADTVRLDEIRAHYYRTHPDVNPSGLVAVQPDLGWGP